MNRLIQWCVTVGPEKIAMFTQTHDRETALAIALATFGHEVCGLEDEGAIKQEISNLHYKLIDPTCCETCGECRGYHDTSCASAPVGAI